MRRLLLACLFILTFTTHAQTNIPPRPVITPENAHQLTQIAQLGRGTILDVVFSADNQHLLVATTIGVWSYTLSDVSAEPTLTPYLFDGTVLFSPNAEWIAIDYPNGDINLINHNDKRVVKLEGQIQSPQDLLSFSPDSQFLLSRDKDGSLFLWDVTTGQLQYILSDERASSWQLDFSPDSKTLLTVKGEVIHSWDVQTGAWLREVVLKPNKRGEFHIRHIQFAPNGNTLVVMDGITTVFHFSAQTGAQQAIFRGRGWMGNNEVMAFSPRQGIFATAGGDIRLSSQGIGDTSIYVWDESLGNEPLLRLDGHHFTVAGLLFNRDGRYLASLGDDVIRIWDMSNGEMVGMIDHEEYRYKTSPDSRILVAGDPLDRLHIVDLTTLSTQVIEDVSPSEGAVFIHNFSPDGHILWVAVSHGYLALLGYDTTTWKLQYDIQANRPGYVFHHPTLPIILFPERYDRTSIVDLQTGESLDATLWEKGIITDLSALQFSQNGEWLIVEPIFSAYTMLVEMNTWQIVDIYKDMCCLSISPDNRLMLGIMNRMVILSERETGDFIHAFEGSAYQIHPDWRYVITKAGEDVAQLWDLQTGEALHQLPNIFSITRQMDANWQTIIHEVNPTRFEVWDVMTGQLRHTIHIPVGVMNTPVLSPDGRLVATIGTGGILRVWDLITGELLFIQPTIPIHLMTGLINPTHLPTIEFSPDGSLILIYGMGITQIWGVS